jgi:hypothetical protein
MISITLMRPAFYAAFQAAMTEQNIKGGFKGAGLVPFDPESVVSKLDVQLQTPTPAEEEASQVNLGLQRPRGQLLRLNLSLNTLSDEL